MKKILAIISFFVITGSLSAQTGGKQYVEIKTSAQCGTCKAAIEKAVGSVEGVKTADLDLDSKVVAVKYDGDKTTAEAIKAAIIAIGYDADELPANPEAYEGLHSCCKKE